MRGDPSGMGSGPGVLMDGGVLDVPLPEGHLVAARDDGRGPVCWVTDGPVPARLWGRLRAAHGRSGLWPVLVFDGLGDLAFGWFASDAVAVDRLDAAAVLVRSWGGFGEGFLTRADRRALGLTTRWWQDWRRLPAPWPGSAPAGVPVADPDRVADVTAARLVEAVTGRGRSRDGGGGRGAGAGTDRPGALTERTAAAATGRPAAATGSSTAASVHPAASAEEGDAGVGDEGDAGAGRKAGIDRAGDRDVTGGVEELAAVANVGPGVQLALVPCARGADALAVAGWIPSDGEPGVPETLAAVVRSWEDRFGARLIGVGGGTLLLSVAAPPVTLEQAVRVAVEHFGFCPEAEPVGGFAYDPDGSQFLQYAADLVGRRLWRFWWD
ncbi:DUF4253 domain-containing protein [Dactylosporangium sp. NPDC050688]|uniref:DUF4253 domain-containing protein n=1 Tax=Dactylosporangium sp. NPDC050688 TaxID=3157217 RepID=UPI0033DA7D6C